MIDLQEFILATVSDRTTSSPVGILVRYTLLQTDQAAIAIAQHVEATIYATVGSQEKNQLLVNQYGIPEERIFSSRDMSFAKGIMRATNGLGVGEFHHSDISRGKSNINTK